MKCRKCGAKMRERTIQPVGIKETVTFYECRNVFCDYDEDDDPRRFHSRLR